MFLRLYYILYYIHYTYIVLLPYLTYFFETFSLVISFLIVFSFWIVSRANLGAFASNFYLKKKETRKFRCGKTVKKASRKRLCATRIPLQQFCKKKSKRKKKRIFFTLFPVGRMRVVACVRLYVCVTINFWPSFEANCSVMLVYVICVSSIVKAYPSYNLSSQPGPLE